MNVSKEWAELFLKNWNRAVRLWDKGHLFRDVWSQELHIKEQREEQLEYARLCCAWLLPHGMVEPHVVAEGG